MTDKKLHAYIDNLGHDIAFENSGKNISQVGERQQRRKIEELNTDVEKALWLTKSFGFSGDDDSNETLWFEENGKNALMICQKRIRIK